MVVIYDNNGKIWYNGSGIGEPVGLPFINIEIPEGQYIEKVDVTSEPHTPVFKDYPKSEVQLLQEAVRVLSEKTTDGTITNPIVWVNGMIAELNKYYTCGGKKYQCIEDSVIGLWSEPQYLARYFKEV